LLGIKFYSETPKLKEEFRKVLIERTLKNSHESIRGLFMKYIEKIESLKNENFKNKKMKYIDYDDIENLKENLDEINTRNLKIMTMISEELKEDKNISLTGFSTVIAIYISLFIASYLEFKEMKHSEIFWWIWIILIAISAGIFVWRGKNTENSNKRITFIQIAINETLEEREEKKIIKRLKNSEKNFSKKKIS